MNTKSTPIKIVLLLLTLVGVVQIALAQSDATLTQAAVGEAQAVDKPSAITKPVLEEQTNSFDRQLIAELDAQQQRLLAALKEEDAFSLELSELYAEYGALLLRASRFDEAKQTYTQALHIQKVNHGIYSPQQIYFLQQLFELAFKTDDPELVDRYLNRAIAIEGKNKDLVSDELGEMYLRAGHYNLDRFYLQKRGYVVKLNLLRAARYYFEELLERNLDQSDESFSLYGELFLVSYLESTLVRDMPVVFSGDRPRFNVSALSSNSAVVEQQLQQDYRYIRRAYNRGFHNFNQYIRNARAIDDTSEVMNALLGWADTLILFGLNAEASKYYQMAWSEAQQILSDEQLLTRFKQPRALPNYEYLLERPEAHANEEVLSVPLILSITKGGSISSIRKFDDSDEQQKYFAAARREVRNTKFRPAIIDGDITAVDQFTYEVKVVVN